MIIQKRKLANILGLMRSNKLSHNASKSELLIVGDRRQLNSSRKALQLKIDDDSIRRAQKVKYFRLAGAETLTGNE